MLRPEENPQILRGPAPYPQYNTGLVQVLILQNVADNLQSLILVCQHLDSLNFGHQSSGHTPSFWVTRPSSRKGRPLGQGSSNTCNYQRPFGVVKAKMPCLESRIMLLTQAREFQRMSSTMELELFRERSFFNFIQTGVPGLHAATLTAAT